MCIRKSTQNSNALQVVSLFFSVTKLVVFRKKHDIQKEHTHECLVNKKVEHKGGLQAQKIVGDWLLPTAEFSLAATAFRFVVKCNTCLWLRFMDILPTRNIRVQADRNGMIILKAPSNKFFFFSNRKRISITKVKTLILFLGQFCAAGLTSLFASFVFCHAQFFVQSRPFYIFTFFTTSV